MNDLGSGGTPVRALFARVAARAPALRQTVAEQRAAKLQKLVDAVFAHKAAIYAAVRKELHLCDTDIDAQLMMVKFEAEFIVKNLKDWMRRRPVPGSIMSLGKTSYVQYEPKGVVLNLATWNAPFAIGLVPAMGALAAGNAVILKPSELAPDSAAVLADIVRAAYPEDEFAVIQGGPEVAQELLALPFNHIFYIGGHAVGRLVMKAAADHFASVTLEMGGKNPTIVDASADIEDAARKISLGRLSNAGQICIAPDYVLAHESVHDRFVEALRRAMTAQYNADGKGFENSPEYPRIVNARHFARVRALVEDARDKGARIAFGGQMRAEDRYIAPTVVTGATEDMKIMQEEIFGPVITVAPFRSREEAVETVARRPKPLAAYIYAKDRAQIEYFLAHTTAGSTVVNHNVIQSGTNPHLPFGGVNHSGIGRLGGWYTFAECSNARSVVEEGPPLGDPNMFFPPYTEKYKKMVASMLGRSLVVPDGVVRAINGIIKLGSPFRRN
ncbi:MAG: aldehyde dehydrogenase family protein [Gammaproteobacteria bacterium]|nr:aldehyde dehydrogenase family protein [Gammaproteobacteria bacterium]